MTDNPRSVKQRAKEIPVIASAYRSARSRYRSLFRFFPLSLINFIRMGDTEPIARNFGLGRGFAIDRYYIERFLTQHTADIRGRVLEIRDANYTTRFGTAVAVSDVLDLSPTNSAATIIGDLTDPETLREAIFDCAIVTQTLQFVYDARTAVESLHRGLKPGGVLLATLPGISKIGTPTAIEGRELYDDFWRFTRFSAARIFGDVFGAGNVSVDAYGNVLASVAFLHGLSTEEIGEHRLNLRDPEYDLVITIRAVKAIEP